jgi:replication factor A1
MAISDLTLRQGNVEVSGTIKEIGEVKTFSKFGRDLRVADSVLEDESGTIKLSLWNEDIDRFKAGDKVKIVNGYVNEFQGEKQLTAGKYGRIEKEGAGGEEEAASQASEETGTDNNAAEEEVDEGSSQEGDEASENAAEEPKDTTDF